MATLIVAFPKLEEAKAVRNLLVRRGYEAASACTSGAQAINMADRLSDGIIICGYSFQIICCIPNCMSISRKALKCCL